MYSSPDSQCKRSRLHCSMQSVWQCRSASALFKCQCYRRYDVLMEQVARTILAHYRVQGKERSIDGFKIEVEVEDVEQISRRVKIEKWGVNHLPVKASYAREGAQNFKLVRVRKSAVIGFIDKKIRRTSYMTFSMLNFHVTK